MIAHKGDQRLHQVVAVTVVLAVSCMAPAALAAFRADLPAAWLLAAVAAGFAAADAALVHLRFGHDRWSFTWAEVVLVIALTVLPPAWIVLLAPVGVAAAHLALRRAPLKVLFNAAVAAVGASAAWAAFSVAGAVSPGSATEPSTSRLVAASLASWAVTTAAISAAVAASQHMPFSRVHFKALRMNLLVWVGNTVIGCLVVSVAAAEPLVLTATPALIAMLALIYRGYLQALEQRDTWERLQAVSRQLLGADAESLAETALDGSLALLQAEFADLLLVEDERGRAGLRWRRAVGEPVEREGGDPFDMAGCWGRVLSDRAPFTVDVRSSTGPQKDELVALGLTSASVAPLLVQDRCLGVLRVGFRGPVRLRKRERQVLETFANHISAAAQSVQLFDMLLSQARHDSLTGLPNRLELGRRLRGTLAEGGPVAVFFLDLDRFKVVNDSLGHHSGDLVLREAASRIRRTLPDGAMAARFGGDEFVVVWPGVADEATAAEIAGRIGAAVATPIEVDGSELLLTASVGVVVASGGAGGSASGLLRDADAAMYLAKERGRDRVELFTTSIRTSAVRRLELETELRAAMQANELVVHYQPIVDLQSRRTLGAEALLRWHNPQRGLMPTPEFVALAEETGLIVNLGGWVLDEAVGSLREWDRTTKEPLTVSINLSARQLTAPRLADEVAAAFDQAGADPTRVTFEVTESSLVDLGGEAVGNLTRLRTIGCTIALDDFGTGWSSLSYLQRLPVDCLKLDRSFVARLDEDIRDRSVVGSMVSLAHALDLVVVAEGVERPAQLDVLVDLGCDAAQGFLLQPPCSGADLIEAIARPGGCWPVTSLRPVSFPNSA